MNQKLQLADAKHYSERKLVPFSVGQILDNSVTDFDVFLNVKNHLILYGAEGYKWQKSELEKLLNAGYESLFINSEELEKVVMYQRLSRVQEVDFSLAPKDRIQSIVEIGAILNKCLYEGGPITAAVLDKGEKLAHGLVATIMEDPKSIQAITGLADHDYYTFYHSVRTASYSVAVAYHMGLRNEEVLKTFALAGIFHDVGKKFLPLNLLNKAGALTPTEWQDMRSHPLKGSELILNTNSSPIIKEVILHHHERMDGSGYPHGLDGSSILTEVQIVALADVFDALTSARAYQVKRSRYEALDLIKHQMLGTKIALDPFRALVSTLANS